MTGEVIPDPETAYGERVRRRLGSAATFAERFSVPVRVRLTRVRGF